MTIEVGKTYKRFDGTFRRVLEIIKDCRYPSGQMVRFGCWDGPNPKLKPGCGFSDLEVFKANTEQESPNEPVPTVWY